MLNMNYDIVKNPYEDLSRCNENSFERLPGEIEELTGVRAALY